MTMKQLMAIRENASREHDDWTLALSFKAIRKLSGNSTEATEAEDHEALELCGLLAEEME